MRRAVIEVWMTDECADGVAEKITEEAVMPCTVLRVVDTQDRK